MMHETPMTCDALDALLADYVANTLDDATAEAIEAHVGGCARCEVVLEQATRVDVSAYAPPVPDDVRARVLAAVPRRAAPRHRVAWLAAVGAVAAAAALAVSTMRQPVPVAAPSAAVPVDAMASASAMANAQAASEFQSLDAATQELEQALKAAPDDREMRAYLDAVRARRAELASKVAEAAS